MAGPPNPIVAMSANHAKLAARDSDSASDVGEPRDAKWAASLTALRGLFLLAMHHGCHLPPDLVAGALAEDMVQGVLRVLRHAGFERRLSLPCSIPPENNSV